jgi:hypothetical protein
MEDLKGLAEVADRLVYEALALVVPGAALIMAAMAAMGADAAVWAATSAGEHPWLAASASWVVGLVLQGASRLITDVSDLLFKSPWRVIRAIMPPKQPAAVDASQADLKAVARAYWQKRLGIPPGSALRSQDVRDLSFSVITSAQGRLSRFRALSSGTRALAAAAAIGAVYAIVFPAVTIHSVPLGWFVTAGIALVSYFALMQRSRMYDQLWDDIITPQFLATVTGQPAVPGVDDR